MFVRSRFHLDSIQCAADTAVHLQPLRVADLFMMLTISPFVKSWAIAQILEGLPCPKGREID